MSQKSICHISTVHSVNDSRIFYKECQTLVKNNFEVNLVINAERSGLMEGVNVIALPPAKNRISRVFFLSFKAFFKAWKTHASIYHFHDPELIFIGFLFKILGKKVIYDVHEDLREDILLKRWLGGRFITKFFSHASSFAEKLADYFFDAIVAATPKISAHFSPRKTITLRNFVMLSNFSKAKVNENKKISKNHKKILIYIGSLAEIRGIKEIICSMAEVDIETELWLIGRWENEQFRRECEALPEFKRVKYVGYINHNKIPSYLRLADVGLVTLHPTTTFIESYPIKVFEYMSSALPVIMSDFLLWKELFKDAAIFVDPLNVKDIANKIQYILSQDEIRKNIALKGENLVLTKYNWEMESKKLIHLYDLLLKSSD